MDLTIDGERRSLIDIAAFREAQGLPDSFGITQFATADAPYNRFWLNEEGRFAGLAEQLVQVVPDYIDLSNITEVPHMVTTVFEHELVSLGADMGLTREEVEMTATDFRNVLEPAVYKLVELNYLNQNEKAAVREQFDIEAIYQEMLDSTVFVDVQPHDYEQGEETWQIHVFHTVFGPMGLKVETAAGEIYYVEDRAVAFPAIELIHELSIAVGQKICAVFTA